MLSPCIELKSEEENASVLILPAIVGEKNTIIKTVITYANRLITNITSIFPRGFTPTIQGIPVKPIEMPYWL